MQSIQKKQQEAALAKFINIGIFVEVRGYILPYPKNIALEKAVFSDELVGIINDYYNERK
ncbi:hypothetical protein [Sulfurimonas sp. CS5]|uniref:hypothetical protein n=1 Tax=Sulfurimonas sp. CS5 TaxID=3391145 RepID=UPI0039E975AB